MVGVKKVKHLDLFSGIGGFALAARWLGWETVGFSEIDEYANKILKKQWPNVKNYGDIRNIEKIECDIITGGFPCQPFSVGGSQRAEADDRFLWPEMLRVITSSRPAYVLAENVFGIIKLGLDKVQFDLENEGYTSRAIVVPACAAGFNNRRERVWILAHSPSNGFDGGSSSRSDEETDEQCTKGEEEIGDDEGCGGLRLGMDGRGDPTRGWRTEPPALRVDVGVSPRLDKDRMSRNKAIGNAIAPDIAYEIMKGLAF